MYSAFSYNQEEEMEAEEALLNAEPARPLKRLRLRGQENNSPSSASSPSKKSHIEKTTAREGGSSQQPRNKALLSDGNGRIAAHPGPMRDASSDRGKQPASTYAYALAEPKAEPVDEYESDYTRPIAIVPPGIQ